MRYHLIACEVLTRECAAAIATAPPIIDTTFLPKHLHDMGAEGMRQALQAAIDAVPASVDAVLLGYALCNNGTAGLVARQAPLVIPRAHDCITLFLGSRQRYDQYFDAHPGVYFKTTGWVERGGPMSQADGAFAESSWEALVAKYGEDNAQYLLEALGDQVRHYGQLTYIRMGIAPEDAHVAHVAAEAEDRGWAFEEVQGDMSLFHRLCLGQWDERDYVVVPPGARTVARYDGTILGVEAEKLDTDSP